MNRTILKLSAGVFLAFLPGTWLSGADSIVENTNDAGEGSLRNAISNIDPDAANLITFSAAISGQTISLSDQLEIALNGSGAVTIDAGALENPVTLDGANQSRLFRIMNGTTVLRNLLLTGGLPSAAQVADSSESGGAILADQNALLRLENCEVVGNSARNGATDSFGGSGGGIACIGELEVFDSTVEGNRTGFGGSEVAVGPGVSGSGGGLWVQGELDLVNSVVKGNQCNPSGAAAGFTIGATGGNGGGIYLDGNGSIEGSVIENNLAGRGSPADSGRGGKGGDGGGLYLRSGNCQIIDTLFYRNRAGGGSATETGVAGGVGGEGGALSVPTGTIEMRRSRLLENEPGSGGVLRSSGVAAAGGETAGIHIGSAGAHLIENSIIARNPGIGVLLAGAGSVSHIHVTVFRNVGESGAGVVHRSGVIGFRDSISALNGTLDNGDLVENNTEGTIQLNGENLIQGNPRLHEPASFLSAGYLSPLPRSPAVNQAQSFAGTPAVDVRNALRDDNAPDIGAVESAWRPDQRIGKKRRLASHRGNDIYNRNGSGQKRTLRIRGRKGKAYLSSQSDGDADDFRMRARGANRKVGLRVFRLTGGRSNVTGAVKRNRIVARTVAGGSPVTFRIESRPKTNGKRLKKKVKFQLTSVGDSRKSDVALLRVIKR